MQFGSARLTVSAGDILVILSATGGDHVATFVRTGEGGEILVYDNTKERNRNLDVIPDPAARQRMKARNPDNTGMTHLLHDLKAPTNGQPSVYSPDNGAIALGVVPAKGGVADAALQEAAGRVRMYHGSSADGDKQCSDFCSALAREAGYSLGVQDSSSTTSFKEAMDPARIERGDSPRP